MTFKLVIKEVALDQGFYASFMPKPFSEHPGSGMHTHLSLFEGEKNAFYEEGAPLQLSQVGRSFIAGLLKHAPEYSAITNQWVNSYKRIHGGGEAPAFISWGPHNRNSLVRIPMYKPNKPNSTRIELRSPDSACNPYLAFAVILAAGLKGIEEKYQLPDAPEIDLHQAEAALAAGFEPLPRDLNQAITAMSQSALVKETLGDHVFEYVLRNKRAEWAEYERQVSMYEIDRYLPVL